MTVVYVNPAGSLLHLGKRREAVQLTGRVGFESEDNQCPCLIILSQLQHIRKIFRITAVHNPVNRITFKRELLPKLS